MKLFGRCFYRTMFGLAQVFDAHAPDGSAVRVLKLGGVWQSATYLDERRFEPAFAYYRAFDVALGGSGPSPEASRVAHVLMLGGGGFAWPKHVLATRPDACLDVVEVDPAIVGIARRHFFLNDAVAQFDPTHARLRVICADGRSYLEGLAKARSRTLYDAIVNDTFSGAEPVRSLATVEAAQAAKACLVPGGLYLANVVSQEGGSDIGFLRDTAATLQQAFRHVHIIPCADDDFGGEDNYLAVATDGSRIFANAVPFDREFLGNVMRD